MQSKGVVRFFLIALTIVCLYQFALIIPTNGIESKADAYAADMAAKQPAMTWRQHRAAFLDSISGETVFTIPLIKKFTYADLKKSQLAMGLDLKGGMNVLLQVDLRDFLKSLSGNSTDPGFLSALEKAAELQKNTTVRFYQPVRQGLERNGQRALFGLHFWPQRSPEGPYQFRLSRCRCDAGDQGRSG